MSLGAGYEALRNGAALLDLAGRGHIRMKGEDRRRLCHAMATNHIEQLQAGQGCYAFFLNAQGRVLADANILALDEELLLDTEPETSRFVAEHLGKYIIADDVTLDEATARWAALGVEGQGAAEALASLGVEDLPPAYGWRPWGFRIVAGLSATGAPGYRVFTPAADKAALCAQLAGSGVQPASEEAARAVRLENARPRYGEDIGGAHLSQETQLLHALHFNKGCYLGQEIVERVRSRGHVNRLLVHLHIAGTEAPAPGTKLMAGEKEAGELTSAAWSPALGRIVALGYVRAEVAAAKAVMQAAGAAVEFSGLTPH